MRPSCLVIPFAVIMIAPLAYAADAGQESNQNAGKIREVTLYRDRALVTREIELPPGESPRSLTVPDLPVSVIQNSIYAEGSQNTVVRALRISQSTTAKMPLEELKELRDQAAELVLDELERVEDETQDLEKQLDRLRANDDHGAADRLLNRQIRRTCFARRLFDIGQGPDFRGPPGRDFGGYKGRKTEGPTDP